MKISNFCLFIFATLGIFTSVRAVFTDDPLVLGLLVLMANHQTSSYKLDQFDEDFMPYNDINKKYFSPRMGKRYFSPRMGKRDSSLTMSLSRIPPKWLKRYFSPRMGK